MLAIYGINWTPDLCTFITDHAERRITLGNQEFFKTKPDKCWVVRATIFGEVAGYSASGLQDGVVVHNITVVHKEHRGGGIGSDMLAHKINLIERDGYQHTTIVAEDNIKSRKMCEKVGLTIIKSEVKTRRDGEFTALTFGKNK